jgi:hypothetical protein
MTLIRHLKEFDPHHPDKKKMMVALVKFDGIPAQYVLKSEMCTRQGQDTEIPIESELCNIVYECVQKVKWHAVRSLAMFSSSRGQETIQWMLQTWFDGVGIMTWVMKQNPAADRLRDVLLKVCAMLQYLQQELQFTHRDLHGENVLVANDGSVCLIDFGQSLIRDPDGAESFGNPDALTKTYKRTRTPHTSNNPRYERRCLYKGRASLDLVTMCAHIMPLLATRSDFASRRIVQMCTFAMNVVGRDRAEFWRDAVPQVDKNGYLANHVHWAVAYTYAACSSVRVFEPGVMASILLRPQPLLVQVSRLGRTDHTDETRNMVMNNTINVIEFMRQEPVIRERVMLGADGATRHYVAVLTALRKGRHLNGNVEILLKEDAKRAYVAFLEVAGTVHTFYYTVINNVGKFASAHMATGMWYLKTGVNGGLDRAEARRIYESYMDPAESLDGIPCVLTPDTLKQHGYMMDGGDLVRKYPGYKGTMYVHFIDRVHPTGTRDEPASRTAAWQCDVAWDFRCFGSAPIMQHLTDCDGHEAVLRMLLSIAKTTCKNVSFAALPAASGCHMSLVEGPVSAVTRTARIEGVLGLLCVFTRPDGSNGSIGLTVDEADRLRKVKLPLVRGRIDVESLFIDYSDETKLLTFPFASVYVIQREPRCAMALCVRDATNTKAAVYIVDPKKTLFDILGALTSVATSDVRPDTPVGELATGSDGVLRVTTNSMIRVHWFGATTVVAVPKDIGLRDTLRNLRDVASRRFNLTGTYTLTRDGARLDLTSTVESVLGGDIRIEEEREDEGEEREEREEQQQRVAVLDGYGRRMITVGVSPTATLGLFLSLVYEKLGRTDGDSNARFYMPAPHGVKRAKKRTEALSMTRPMSDFATVSLNMFIPDVIPDDDDILVLDPDEDDDILVLDPDED